MTKFFVLTAVILLAGCSSQASRMADCQAQGVSRDACYIAEQNRQASITAAAEKQAMENAVKQYAQATSKVVKVRIAGVALKIYPADKQCYVDGVAAAMTEDNVDATTYKQGFYDVIHYKRTHKIVLLNKGQIIGRAKG
ncbi:hypothetical protein [Rahnella inusitata]|uniref:hypothetical protein n=1 Tax=Rahnella inusitata TaxID=58169 RepID=UPI0039BDB03A